MNISYAGLFLLAGVIGIAGCRSPVDGYFGPRGTVAGSIAVDGQPIAQGCQVVFIAKGGNFIASGTVEQDGRYTLLYRVAQGLPIGDYAVQLGLPRDFAPIADPGDLRPRDLKEITRAWRAAMPFSERYLTTATSGLEFTVQPGANTADFDLAKTGRAGKVGT
jgi:hypothetical protein